jgi:hypothetical protein
LKIIRITWIVLVAAAVLSFVRAQETFDIVKALPFCDGEPVNSYHIGALIICLIALWGFSRLGRRNNDEE